MTKTPPIAVTLTICVQAPMHNWLRAMAVERDVSLATVVRAILMERAPEDVRKACQPLLPRKLATNTPKEAIEIEEEKKVAAKHAKPAEQDTPPISKGPPASSEFLVQTYARRVRELADRGLGQTAIASMLRLPYAVVGAALILTAKGD